jgi:hypothetical protein
MLMLLLMLMLGVEIGVIGTRWGVDLLPMEGRKESKEKKGREESIKWESTQITWIPRC